ncbi:type II toxin-antitoxin system HicB family antitoxin [Nocardiopsis mangrovi]|uniref:Type II toxin-antitoxin system HicB family antitoxin n=1 Tax=Nocardiopsis mangrovi TaxID=1179818 RepID=A0ABV9DXS5_9ACTN
MSNYVILIERAPDGYGAWCPDLPGCVALGDTIEETISEMQDAMRCHLELMREDGLPIPAPNTVAATMTAVDVAAA